MSPIEEGTLLDPEDLYIHWESSDERKGPKVQLSQDQL